MKDGPAMRPAKSWLMTIFLQVLLFFPLSVAAFASGQESPTIHLTPAALFPGDVAMVTLAPADAVVSASVFWEGKRIPLARLAERDALAAFFAISKDEKKGPKELSLTLLLADGKRSSRILTFNVEPKEFPVQRLSLPKGKVTLSKKDLARHQQEKAAINSALADPLAGRIWQNSFQRPVKGEVSTVFGVRRILNGKPRNSHSGVDLRGKKGGPVAAPSDGIVILTGEHFFAGKSVYVDHGMGLVTMYFHLSEIRVAKGDHVSAGQTIGLLGSTGRSTGPHLHWGLRVHDHPADPLALLALFPQH